MRQWILAIPALFLVWCGLSAQGFDDHFEDATLRLDYMLCAGMRTIRPFISSVPLKTSAWAGRRNNLTKPLLEGTARIRVLDPETGACLYANSFSTLFQEWQVTTEALHVQKAFENCFQVPFPKRPVDVESPSWTRTPESVVLPETSDRPQGYPDPPGRGQRSVLRGRLAGRSPGQGH